MFKDYLGYSCGFVLGCNAHKSVVGGGGEGGGEGTIHAIDGLIWKGLFMMQDGIVTKLDFVFYKSGQTNFYLKRNISNSRCSIEQNNTICCLPIDNNFCRD